MTAWILPTRAATSRFGEALGKRLRAGDTIALIGDLGAGKTTLAQAIARGCGITSPVSSPTFGLIHEYAGRLPLFHFDPYRLQHPEDLSDLGFHEYFDRGGIVLVEWADKVEQLLPRERITLRLEIEMEPEPAEFREDASRLLDVQSDGQRYLDLLVELTETPELRDLRASGPETYKR